MIAKGALNLSCPCAHIICCVTHSSSHEWGESIFPSFESVNVSGPQNVVAVCILLISAFCLASVFTTVGLLEKEQQL